MLIKKLAFAAVFALTILSSSHAFATWDVTTPAGSEAKSLGDDRIRELKIDIQTALQYGNTSYFPGSDPSNPRYIPTISTVTTAGRPTGNAAPTGRVVINITSSTLEIVNAAGVWSPVNIVSSSGPVIYVKFQPFNAVGDGATDDTSAIQSAIDYAASIGGATIDFGNGYYRINKSTGVNDNWGIKITSHNITLQGNGAKFRRYNVNLSTWSYPILFIGTPDSNTADTISSVKVRGITFIGEDQRHSDSGSVIHDGRCAIEVKNSSGTVIENCAFERIDSQAIYFQKPGEYDYFDNVYYNLTKSWRARIVNNSFTGVPHSTNDRALMHAIASMGVDDLVVANNSFEWCDNTISQETSYGTYTDQETDLYPSGTAMGNLRRTGRGVVYSGNHVKNSSEHAVYFGGMDIAVTGNTFIVDNTTVCPNDQIKLRARGVVISGNMVRAGSQAISINEPSSDVTVTGNRLLALSDGAGGVININSDGLSTYITDRPWYNTSGFFPMSGIVITGNTLQLLTSTQTHGIGIRVLTDGSDANYSSNGQIQDLIIADNTFRNHRNAISIQGPLIQQAKITDNIFHAKPFVLTAFTTNTVMFTESVINVYRDYSDVLTQFTFNGNTVFGAQNLFKTDNGGGSSVHLPFGISNNKFNYIQFISSGGFRTIDAYNQFKNNTGGQFLDRTWSPKGTGNSLLNGAGDADSAYRYTQIYDGSSTIKFYVDDSGTAFTLSSGTYTPTLFNTTNVGASTARLASYYRVGNMVTVAGQLDIDPTIAAATLLGISIPIASDFTTAYEAGGVASVTAVANESAGIEADFTNDRVSLRYIAVDITNHTMTYTFSYHVNP